MIRGPRVSGYTLIEILGAFFIMTIILTLVTGIFVENGRQRAAALGMMKERLSATAAIDQFAQDVESALFLTDPSGRRPDENPWRFQAEDFGELGARSLRFVTQNAPAANRGLHASGWVEVVYFVEADEEEKKTLWRWVAPRPPMEAEADFPRSSDEGAMRVALDVSEFGIRFMGLEGDWVDEWDAAYQSPTTPLPAAVEVNLRLLRDARLGESEEGLEMVPGPLHTRRVVLLMPPLDVNALIELGGGTSGEELDCFTIADCISEGDATWYQSELEDDCGGDDELCDLLSASDANCWDDIERNYPDLAALAPETCAE
jgi:type II secretory pathway component PulJ